jgi:type II secretory pathway component PulF
MGIEIGGFYDLMSDLGHYAENWWWVFPTVVVGLIFWWRRGGAGGFLTSDGGPSKIAWLCPGMKKIANFSRYSQFADLLALLIEQDVPLQEALVLAAEATNDLAIQDAARAVADATSRGWTPSSRLPEHSGFPPFLYWLITRKEEQKGLVSALRAAADMYRRRAVLITEWIKVTFPVLAAVIIGGGATLIYTLTIFYPLTELLKRLAMPAI